MPNSSSKRPNCVGSLLPTSCSPRDSLLPGWCLEYAVAISVSFPKGRTMSGYYVLQQQEIALGILLQSKESIGHFTRGIINGTYKG